MNCPKRRKKLREPTMNLRGRALIITGVGAAVEIVGLMLFVIRCSFYIGGGSVVARALCDSFLTDISLVMIFVGALLLSLGLVRLWSSKE